jgi:hypothetical protein
MTKTILDIVDRNPTPAPWSEGDNFPWDDPGFSKRMLAGATLPIAAMHQCGTWHPCTIQQLCTWHHADNATMRYVAPM